ncbi:UTP--glucose-1-phosphate uridylyltransferase [Limibaculum sp. FT325]|uniref:UTP--glucose-1-phosphate uridylyltransferase n=1 Tax=Thermohalobaculum sediminis TaxID=2939436 RepID=UPI0020BF79EC|nr:UTP--glucose-1-phosphate uridylyltransferase [Limibaculum sediminis]MCL5778260.1 UTP--glucose-1-phosphate uridylyltransferase [Limibaculum sediminis]
MSSTRIRTAVFPVAGLGTRFLPATKATPKELLPVVDTPLIQFAIDEARAAGIDRMVFVSHPSKGAIETYVRQDAALSRTLRERGKARLAARLDALALDADEDVIFVMQPEPLGLGHAVLCAREHVEGEAFAVLLPDDLILGRPGCLEEMIRAHALHGGHLVAAMEVPPDATASYGILEPGAVEGRLVPARGIVEKPAPAEAPSRLAVVGRYVLDASILDDLARQGPGAGGEIQLTDAIAAGIERVGLAGFRFSGTRYDCGSKAGMLAATLARASADPACAEVLAAFRDGIQPRTAAA